VENDKKIKKNNNEQQMGGLLPHIKIFSASFYSFLLLEHHQGVDYY
jgi:hypothetical protein